jgi:hypothetical protein
MAVFFVVRRISISVLVMSMYSIQEKLKHTVSARGDCPLTDSPADGTLIAFEVGFNEGHDAVIMKAPRAHRVFRGAIESRLFFHQESLGISHRPAPSSDPLLL